MLCAFFFFFFFFASLVPSIHLVPRMLFASLVSSINLVPRMLRPKTEPGNQSHWEQKADILQHYDRGESTATIRN